MLAGAPASLRAYARVRSELRHGTLPRATQHRIALAVAEHQRSEYALATLQRTAREAGLGSTRWPSRGSSTPTTSATRSCCATSRRCSRATVRRRFTCTRRHARPGWEDEQILEAVSHVAMNSFANLVTRAGDVPRDGSVEESRLARAA